jgi:hypothetical protein
LFSFSDESVGGDREMPNGGFDGSIEAWEKMEAPLLEVDGLLARFAAERNMQVVKNYHNWPQRYLEWVKDGIHRAIQIVAANESKMTFHLGVGAWKDRGDQRYGADELLKKFVPWDEIRDNLDQLLEEGFKTLESWSEKDLHRPKQA